MGSIEEALLCLSLLLPLMLPCTLSGLAATRARSSELGACPQASCSCAVGTREDSVGLCMIRRSPSPRMAASLEEKVS